MGGIRSTLIKRTSKKLLESDSDIFNESFENNKKALGKTMPGKKIKNKIAGYIVRLKRLEKKNQIIQTKEVP